MSHLKTFPEISRLVGIDHVHSPNSAYVCSSVRHLIRHMLASCLLEHAASLVRLYERSASALRNLLQPLIERHEVVTYDLLVGGSLLGWVDVVACGGSELLLDGIETWWHLGSVLLRLRCGNNKTNPCRRSPPLELLGHLLERTLCLIWLFVIGGSWLTESGWIRLMCCLFRGC